LEYVPVPFEQVQGALKAGHVPAILPLAITVGRKNPIWLGAVWLNCWKIGANQPIAYNS
jgi:hypothetical protein